MHIDLVEIGWVILMIVAVDGLLKTTWEKIGDWLETCAVDFLVLLIYICLPAGLFYVVFVRPEYLFDSLLYTFAAFLFCGAIWAVGIVLMDLSIAIKDAATKAYSAITAWAKHPTKPTITH